MPSPDNQQQDSENAEAASDEKDETKKSQDSKTTDAESKVQTKEDKGTSMQDFVRQASAIGDTTTTKQIVVWSMTNFFDWNPAYLKQFRGILNVAHVILSLISLSLMASACRMGVYPGEESLTFLCNAQGTFLFVIACCSFLSSLLFLVCCLLSSRSDLMLYAISYEVSFYMFFFILLLSSSASLMINSFRRSAIRIPRDDFYELSQTAAILSLVNSILYGLSVVWFFIHHRFHGGEIHTVE